MNLDNPKSIFIHKNKESESYKRISKYDDVYHKSEKRYEVLYIHIFRISEEASNWKEWNQKLQI